MKKSVIQSSALAGLLLAAVGSAPSASAADLKSGTLRVGILQDVVNFDPLQFSAVNYPLIRNLYDALIDYTPEGKAVPGLVEFWQIAPDNGSVTMKLRGDVNFTDGTPLTADAVAATLKKAADPVAGKNVYPTMSIVKDWSIGDPHTVTIHFANPVPDRQITDLLQSICVIEPSVVDSVETKVGGTGSLHARRACSGPAAAAGCQSEILARGPAGFARGGRDGIQRQRGGIGSFGVSAVWT